MDENIKTNQAAPEIDVKSAVMRKIQARHVKMTSPPVVLAKKIGLESMLALSVFAGAIAISAVFYVLKKIGELQLLSLDLPTIVRKIILLLPYDYIVLFLITVILGAFLVKDIFYFQGVQFSKRISAIFLFLITLMIGLFFAYMGIGQVGKGLINPEKTSANTFLK